MSGPSDEHSRGDAPPAGIDGTGGMPSDSGDPAEKDRRPTSVPRLVFLVLLALALALVARTFLSGLTANGRQHPAVGTALANVTLQPLTGEGPPVTPESLAGKVVLINYWGTWCGPCRVEFPHIVELAHRFSDEPDFQLLSVSCPAGDESDERLRDETRRYLEKQGADIPTYSDPGAISRRELLRAAKLDQFVVPTSVLLDRQGIIRGLWAGFERGDERQMQAAIAKLLDGIAAP